MRPAVLIANPKAGRQRARRRLERVLAELRRSGYAAEARITRAPGDATRLAAEAVSGGARAVFALGGDGTFRETAKGLLGTDVPLGPLAAGTANVLVRSLGLPRRPLATARTMAGLEPRSIDVGLCDGEPFLMMASCGLDARTVARAESPLKRRLGVIAYLIAGLREWLRGSPRNLEVELDGELRPAALAIVTSIPHYAGPFRIAPGARPDDGRLHLLLVRGGGRIAACLFLLGVVFGRHHRMRGVELLPVSDQVVLRSTGPEPIQLDGDALGLETPGTVRLDSRKLRVLAPPARG